MGEIIKFDICRNEKKKKKMRKKLRNKIMKMIQ